MRGDLLQVARPEPRCLRQRGSILIPALTNLPQTGCPGGALPPQRSFN
jgi:hypothetical protein